MGISTCEKDDNRPVALLVGPVPPPLFGQAIAMQMLLGATNLRASYRLVHLNTNYLGTGRVRRVFSTFDLLLRYGVELARQKPCLLYLMVTRSKLGCVKDFVFVTLAGLRSVPVVVHLHGGDLAVFHARLRGLWKWLVRSIYRRVRIAIVLGDSLRPQFDGMLPEHRVRVVPNSWFDGGGCIPSDRPGRAAQDSLRITFLSNVLPSKGLYDALEGVSLAIRQGVKVEFRFAGAFLDHDGAVAKLPELAHENVSAQVLAERYERTVRSLGIAQYVRRLGPVAARAKWGLLAETDILLLPIYNPTEGQPLAVIEAMRARCAIISTCCGGLVDIVEDGVTGKVVPPKNPKAIADAIKWFWDHPDELQEISAANRRRAEELHSPREHIRKIQDIFDRTISGNGHRTRREAK